MRPLRLKMNAFGPFPAEQTLDFADLGGNAFFLVHGPTGSGKTTILDAICYALYGESTGAERNGQQMRSHHAAEDHLTSVTLDFRLGQTDFRVTRSPRQRRPKLRGEGYTEDNPKATLWRLEDNGETEVLATGAGPATDALERMLGFRADQFRQVVMLPQGQFRKLLASNSQDREVILETLFQTDRYRRIQESLNRAARDLANQRKNITQLETVILEQAEAENTEELKIRRGQVDKQVTDAASAVTGLQAAAGAARGALTQGERDVEKLDEFKMASDALASLDEQSVGVERQREELGLARKAAPLIADLAALELRREEAVTAAKRVRDTSDELAESKVGLAEATAALKGQIEKDDQRKAAQRRIDDLDRHSDQVQELESLRKALATAQIELDGIDDALGLAEVAVQDGKAQLEQGRQDQSDAVKLADLLESRQKAVDDLKHTRDDRRRLDDEEAALQLTETKAEDAVRQRRAADAALDEARKLLETLESAWLGGQAAVLAADLVDGRPCSVCGSTDHPTPAATQADLPTESDIEAARQAVQDCEGSLQKRRKDESEAAHRVAELRATVTHLAERLDEHGDDTVLSMALDEARADLKASEQAAETLSDLDAALPGLEETLTERTGERDSLKNRHQVASDGVTSQVAVVNRTEQGLPEGLRSAESLATAMETAREHLTALEDALKDAREDERQASVAHKNLQTQLKVLQKAENQAAGMVAQLAGAFALALQGADFRNEGAVTDACRADVEIDALEGAIQEFDNALHAARDHLERAQQAAEGIQAPDIDVLTAAAEAAEQEAKAGQESLSELQQTLKTVDGWLEQLADAAAESRQLAGRYKVVGHLAEVANGANKLRMTFQRFVLAALLDDVLRNASERLRKMSRQRFTLERIKTQDDQRQHGGLDLQVHDAYTGTARKVSTLSGGEGFLASLSLALGLADVVQAAEGGIHLDTVFVDEGFGTLDPEALEQALKTLIDLQASGRLVGIISHVSELREHIDARLEVTPSRNGSTARFVVP